MRGRPIPVVNREKQCTKCRQWKSLDLFYPYFRNGRILYLPDCKACHRIITDAYHQRNKERLLNMRRANYPRTRIVERARVKKRKENNPDKMLSQTRNRRFKNRYGITLDVYNQMFTAQDGRCAICLTREKRLRSDGTPYNLSVDHNHKTKTVRNLLCYTCNSVLGYLNEDISMVQSVLRYLKAWEDK